jgi:ferritin heavy chain
LQLSTTPNNRSKMSQVRMNFHATSEETINKQINMELYASYTYMAMSAYFARDTQALPGFAKFFRKQSDEEREHAIKLVEYQNMRGGKVVFQDINRPNKNEWAHPLEAVEDAMDMERAVNQALLDLHKTAEKACDAQMTDFLEGEFLKEQVESINEIGHLITKIKRVGEGLGLYTIDKDLSS